jgi:hypothetical protein
MGLDLYIWAPIVAKGIIPLIFQVILYSVDFKLGKNILGFLCEIAIVIYANFLKTQEWCNPINTASIMNTITYSLMSYGWAFLLPIVAAFIPFIGMAIRTLRQAPFSGSIITAILWAVGYLFIAPIINLDKEHSKSNLCKEPFYKRTKDIILTGIAIFLIWLERL